MRANSSPEPDESAEMPPELVPTMSTAYHRLPSPQLLLTNPPRRRHLLCVIVAINDTESRGGITRPCPPLRIRSCETERAAQMKFQHHVCVCIAAGCLSGGADHVRDALNKEVAESGMRNEVLVKGVGCMGLCSAGPLVTAETAVETAVNTDVQMFASVTPEDAPEIIRSLDTGGATGGDLAAAGLHPCPTNVPFFERQKKIVLENSGKIDPERIEDYIAHDGYVALVTAITEMTPLEVIDRVKNSGLRGRGGAGYPTGLKWSTVAKTGEQQKYVIC